MKKKSEYYNMSSALDDLNNNAVGGAEKAGAVAKLFGKGLFNTIKFISKEVIPAASEGISKQLVQKGNEALKGDNLTDEQREEYTSIVEKEKQNLEQIKMQKRAKREDDAILAEQCEIHTTEKIKVDHEQKVQLTKDDEHNLSQVLQGTFVSTQILLDESEKNKTLTRAPLLIDCLQEIKIKNSDKDRIFVYPNIPQDKAKNALKSHDFRSAMNKNVLLLIDDTFFGSAEDGLIITENILSTKELFCSADLYTLHGGFASRMLDSYKLTNVSNDYLREILKVMNDYDSQRLKYLLHRALEGDIESQLLYSQSLRVLEMPDESNYWLYKAAAGGQATAQHNLAMNLERLNPKESVYWYSRAVSQGKHEDLANINRITKNGTITPSSVETEITVNPDYSAMEKSRSVAQLRAARDSLLRAKKRFLIECDLDI